MRAALSNYLVKMATEHDNFIILSGDHGYALFDDVRRLFPNKFINVGVSEQAMVGYAAGLAKSGFKVLIYGLGAFVPLRVFEFIKMDICYDKQSIVILGDGAGLVYNTLGASHQCSEDISMMRTLPNMNVFSPADKYELTASLDKAFSSLNSSYLRIGKSDKQEVNSNQIIIDEFGFNVLNNVDSEIAIFATGSLVSTAISISKKLDCKVISVPFFSHLKDVNIKSLIGKIGRAHV